MIMAKYVIIQVSKNYKYAMYFPCYLNKSDKGSPADVQAISPVIKRNGVHLCSTAISNRYLTPYVRTLENVCQ